MQRAVGGMRRHLVIQGAEDPNRSGDSRRLESRRLIDRRHIPQKRLPTKSAGVLDGETGRVRTSQAGIRLLLVTDEDSGRERRNGGGTGFGVEG